MCIRDSLRSSARCAPSLFQRWRLLVGIAMPMRPPAAAVAPPLAVFVLPVRVLLHAPTPASRSVAPATAATIFVLLRDIVVRPFIPPPDRPAVSGAHLRAPSTSDVLVLRWNSAPPRRRSASQGLNLLLR